MSVADSAENSTAEIRAADRHWHIVGRWQEFDSEMRANFLRMIGLGAFYAIELANHYGVNFGPLEMPKVEGVDRAYHLQITLIVLAWCMLAVGVHLSLLQRVFPKGMKYAVTAGDLLFLTSVLLISAGPRSPLVVGYFLIVVLASLRFSLGLVWLATAGSCAGYLVVLGYARWFAAERMPTVPRYHQAVMLLALMLSGVVLGQVVRAVRGMADAYAARLAHPPRTTP